MIEGPSGSGKTTLLMLLGGLELPSAGTVRWRGRDLASLTPAQRDAWRARLIGFVFQGFYLLSALTARENVEVALVPLGVPAAQRRRRAQELLEQVGLGDRADHRPAQLSGGEQQRVALARALAADPPVLLADEPTGNLDRRSAEAVLQLLAQQAQRGKAVVVVTHAPQAREYATRWARMEDGRLLPG